MIVAIGELPNFPVRKSPPSRMLWWLMLALWIVSAASTAHLVLLGRSLSPAAIEVVRSGEGCGDVADCDEVLQSEYASLFGVSLTRWAALYSLLLLLTLVASAFGGHDVRSPPTALLLPVIAALGMAAAIWLVPVMLLRLDAVCPVCLVLHGANVFLFIGALIYAHQAWLHRQFQRWISGEPPMPAWPRWLQGASVALLTAGLVAALALFHSEPATPLELDVVPARQLAVAQVAGVDWQALVVTEPHASLKSKLGDPPKGTWLGAADAPVRLVVFTCLTNKDGARLHEALLAVLRLHPESLRIDLRFDPQWPTCNENYAGQTLDEAHRDACVIDRLAIALAEVDQQAFEQYVNWAFANQHLLNEARAIAEARYLIGEQRLAEVKDAPAAWERTAADIRLAGALKLATLPAVFCEQGTVYGGADAVNLHQFLRLQYGLSGGGAELPALEPVWMGEHLLRSHARSGANLAARQRYDEAVVELRRGLQLQPHWPRVAAQLAWLLATCPEADVRDGEQAVYYARLAMRFAEQEARERNSRRVDPVFHEVLAAAYAEQGEFDSALSAADKAVDGHLINGNKQLGLAADEQRKTYLRHEALRSTELKPTGAATIGKES